MRWGTSHFVSFAAAVEYYKHHQPNFATSIIRRYVSDKLDSGDIHIGPPELKPGETLHIIPNEGRYAVDDGKP